MYRGNDGREYGAFVFLLPGDDILISMAHNLFEVDDESKHLRKDGILIVYMRVIGFPKEISDFHAKLMEHREAMDFKDSKRKRRDSDDEDPEVVF